MRTLAIEGGKPVRKEILPFGVPFIGAEEIREVTNTLESGWIGTGPKVQQFESEFASYVNARFAVALNSCTSGLHLALILAGVRAGDEVIVPSLTFVATANVVEHVGARPVIVDIDPISLCISSTEIEKAISPRTRAVIPVHFGGMPCDLDSIATLASTFNLLVIEDAAHAVGARFCGKMVGSISPFTSFSFYATKNLTTGEGGMVTTDVEHWDEALRRYRLHGLQRDAWARYGKELIQPNAVLPGYKYNMTDVNASIGIHQLHKQELFLEKRRRIAEQYDLVFQELGGLVRVQPRPSLNTRHAQHLYTLILDLKQLTVDRDAVVRALLAENIGVAVHFLPVHMQPYYQKKYGYLPTQLPNSHVVGESILSLPLMPQMTDNDVLDVIEAVTTVLAAYKR